MAKCGYSVVTTADVALAAATAKSVIGVKGHANFGIDLTYAAIGFDGVTASAIPGLVELCYCTFATNSPPAHAAPLKNTFFAPSAAPPNGVTLIVVAPVFVTAGMNQIGGRVAA